MSYVPGYDFDFFFSYASVDNDPVPSSDLGWVDTLVRIITSGSGLAGKLGRREAFNYWIDKQQLRGNHEVDDHIPDQVRRSALMVVILSPGYLASKFCLLELETFLKRVGQSNQRLFVISTERLDDSHPVPESLRRPRKFDFWRFDKNNKSRILGWPQPQHDNADDRPYFMAVEDLCKDIAEKLRELKREAEAAKPAAAPITVASVPASPAGGKTAVLLAETTDDLIRKRDEARRYLEQAGIDVLPAGTYYGLVAAGYENAVLNDLTNSAAFVQLLGPELGRCMPDAPEGFGWLQYNLAKRTQRKLLQWRSPDLGDLVSIDDERQRRLLENAEAMPFEDFKQKIVRIVTAPPPKLEGAGAGGGGRPSFFFINCAAVDTNEADEIGTQLGSNIDWERPPYEDKPKAKVLQSKIETNLIDCDGLLIVHGKARPEWVKDQLQQYRKARARRTQEPRLLAVVQAGHEPQELKGIGLAGLRIIGVGDIPGVVKSALAS